MNKRITKKEIKPIVRDYLQFLPGWREAIPEVLVRTEGPVLQSIGFERLSYGVYRPLNGIQILVAPEPRGPGRIDFFAQTPVGRPMSVSLGLHSRLRDQMLETMRREFVPSISEPLNVENVLDLCEKDAVPTSRQAYALAAFNAYQDHTERALYWCSLYNSLVDNLGQPWQPWHYTERTFLDSLEQWIKNGEVKPQLNKILQEERHKWNFLK